MIKHERPPNFEQILAAFPNANKPGVLFAYGEHIYVPDGRALPAALIAHESVHLENQKQYVNPGLWWDYYISDPAFRYAEELFAHVAEFKAQAPGLDGNFKAKLLMATASRLIAPLYNYVPPRTMQGALADLKREIAR